MSDPQKVNDLEPNDADRGEEWWDAVEKFLDAHPIWYWWRYDDVPQAHEPHVIKICWAHGNAAWGAGWRPGAADMFQDLRDIVEDLCVACRGSINLETGRPPK